MDILLRKFSWTADVNCTFLYESVFHGCVSAIPGLEDDFVGYVFGKRKATEVAHS